MKQWLIIIFCFLVTAFGLSGNSVWPQHIQTIGYYKLAHNPWGIALYQDGIHQTIQYNGFTFSSRIGDTVLVTKHSTRDMSIDFSRDDILFDNTGNVYTESKTQELSEIASQSGLLLTKVQPEHRFRIPAPSMLYIVNPRIPGMVSIQFPSNKNIDINLERKTITFPQSYTLLIVHVYDHIPMFTTNL